MTAGDITVDGDVEIANPDHLICTLTGDVELKMQIKVERGRGYVPANARQQNEDEDRSIGRLLGRRFFQSR